MFETKENMKGHCKRETLVQGTLSMGQVTEGKEKLREMKCPSLQPPKMPEIRIKSWLDGFSLLDMLHFSSINEHKT